MSKITLLMMSLMVSFAYAQNESEDRLKISGEVDLYYSFNLLKPGPVSGTGDSMPAANNQYHIFDAYHNTLALGLAELKLYKKTGPVEAVVDLGFGQNTDLISPSDEVSKNILQAYLTYTPVSAPQWSVSVGKMYTHIGFEVIRSRDNWNYTRSILFGYAGPYWHTGAAVRYVAPNEKFNAGFFLYDENVGLYETGESKSVGMQLSGSLSDKLSATYNFLSGNELDSVGDKHRRTFHEFIGAYEVSSSLEVATDIIYGSLSNIDGDTADWLAWEVLAKYSIGSFYISPRYETFYDKNGVTIELASLTKPSLPQRIQSFTLTSGWMLSKDLDMRLELRQDRSSEDIFVDGDGKAQNSQTTLTLGLMYKF